MSRKALRYNTAMPLPRPVVGTETLSAGSAPSPEDFANGRTIPEVFGTAQVRGRIFAMDYTDGTWTVGWLWCGGSGTISDVILDGAAAPDGITLEHHGQGEAGDDGTSDLLEAAIDDYTDDHDGVMYTVAQYTDAQLSSGVPVAHATIAADHRASLGARTVRPGRWIREFCLRVDLDFDRDSAVAVETANAALSLELGLVLDEPATRLDILDSLCEYAMCWWFTDDNGVIHFTPYSVAEPALPAGRTAHAHTLVARTLRVAAPDRTSAPTRIEVEALIQPTDGLVFEPVAVANTGDDRTLSDRVQVVRMHGWRSAALAARAAQWRLARLKQAEVSWTGWDQHWLFTPGDVVKVESSVDGRSAISVRVTDVEWTGGGVQVSAHVHVAHAYLARVFDVPGSAITRYGPDPGAGLGTISGTGDPADTLGVDGQHYIDADTGALWKKAAGSWGDDPIFTPGTGSGTKWVYGDGDPNGVEGTLSGQSFTLAAATTVDQDGTDQRLRFLRTGFEINEAFLPSGVGPYYLSEFQIQWTSVAGGSGSRIYLAVGANTATSGFATGDELTETFEENWEITLSYGGMTWSWDHSQNWANDTTEPYNWTTTLLSLEDELLAAITAIGANAGAVLTISDGTGSAGTDAVAGEDGWLYLDGSGNVWEHDGTDWDQVYTNAPIDSIERDEDTGVVTITYADGTTDTFTIEDGSDAADLTVASFTTDADGDIVVTFSDGEDVTIPKGRGIASIVRDATTGEVTVTYDDNETDTFNVRDIVSSSRASDGTVTITYSDGTTDTFEVNDGDDGEAGESVTIDSIVTEDDGDIVVTYSDGQTFTIPAAEAGRGIDSITRSGDTVTVTYDDMEDPDEFELMDGEDGEDGTEGLPGFMGVGAKLGYAGQQLSVATTDDPGDWFAGSSSSSAVSRVTGSLAASERVSHWQDALDDVSVLAFTDRDESSTRRYLTETLDAEVDYVAIYFGPQQWAVWQIDTVDVQSYQWTNAQNIENTLNRVELDVTLVASLTPLSGVEWPDQGDDVSWVFSHGMQGEDGEDGTDGAVDDSDFSTT